MSDQPVKSLADRRATFDAKTTRLLVPNVRMDAMRSISQLLGIQLFASLVLACLAVWMGAMLPGGRQLSIGPGTALTLASLLGSVTALLHYLFGDGLKSACRSGLFCFSAIMAIYSFSILLEYVFSFESLQNR
jgi:hypothetical protein